MTEEWQQIKSKKKFVDAERLGSLLEAKGSNSVKLKEKGEIKRE